jgi:hypothetical protein
MSRYAEVIVLARDAEAVMEPLTLPDQFVRHNWGGLLPHLESLTWPDPYSVQVLVRDEEDDCFGLWMLHDGKLTEVPLARTSRRLAPGISITGTLSRTDP